MKQKSLYYVLVICLVIISILLTMLFMSHNNSHNNSDKLQHNYNKQDINARYRDLDYGYDYDGYWFQPSRWWNNLWHDGHSHNYHNRIRGNYDRQDGLNIHNRYNFIQQQPAMQPAMHPAIQPAIQVQPIKNKNDSNEHHYNQPKI